MAEKSLARCLVLLAVAVSIGSAACGGRNRPKPPPAPPPAAQRFTSTAYCRGTTTANGTRVRRGIVAADPKVLPLGSVIRIRGLAGGLDGDYVVADTGPKVRGRQIDIYMDDCRRAVRFGRQRVEVTLLRRT